MLARYTRVHIFIYCSLWCVIIGICYCNALALAAYCRRKKSKKEVRKVEGKGWRITTTINIFILNVPKDYLLTILLERVADVIDFVMYYVLCETAQRILTLMYCNN